MCGTHFEKVGCRVWAMAAPSHRDGLVQGVHRVPLWVQDMIRNVRPSSLPTGLALVPEHSP